MALSSNTREAFLSRTGVGLNSLSLIFHRVGAQLTRLNLDLRTMSVDPDAQGAGVGKRLLRSVMEKAASEGLPVVLESEEGESRVRCKVFWYVYADSRLQRDFRCTCRQALNFSGTPWYWLLRKTAQSRWVVSPAFHILPALGLTSFPC